ncbi:LacI family DNA-binding transcriptional regulator [Rhizobium leguminosarum bv. viciae]|nr:LacI family DNA-binding transcriptional regulator [Rhizobium leguminosarum bv. viciae]
MGKDSAANRSILEPVRLRLVALFGSPSRSSQSVGWCTAEDKSANTDKYWRILIKRQDLQTSPTKEAIKNLSSEGKPMQEIAKLAGVSLATVKRTLRGRR